MIALLAAAVALGAGLLLLTLHNADWRGDEYTYHACARALGDLLAARSSVEAAGRVVVGTGWFMPGMCAVAAPPLAIDPQAPYWLLRGWVWLVNMALLATLAWRLARHFGPWAAALLLLFPALAPLWQAAALRLLPDLPAGLLIALALLLAAELGASLLRGEAPRWRKLLALQLCLVLALYLRGPTLLVALAIDGALLVLALTTPARRWLGRLLLAALVLPLALSPWSLAASHHFDARVITTTNVPLVLADGFGDHAVMCRGPCPTGVGGDIWPAWHWAQAEAARTGEHPFIIERQIMARAMAGVTPREYLATVRENAGRFLIDPGAIFRTQLTRAFAIPPGWREPFYHLLLALTLALYVPFMLALLLGNLLPLGRRNDDRIMTLALKAVTACLLVQPFVHKSSARYWTALAPLASLAAILLWRHWRDRQPVVQQDGAALWLDRVQLAYAALFVAVAGAVLLA